MILRRGAFDFFLCYNHLSGGFVYFRSAFGTRFACLVFGSDSVSFDNAFGVVYSKAKTPLIF